MLTKLVGYWGIKYDNYHCQMTNDKFTKKTF
ncbi:hypothetical protein BD847_0471 [Flavobacterium cutihirudinis]|uniref:Uncharacterized protein n=1 Tax=Flavobacterium cutihirudinis TaxID=1265740 RepID=A0A3D9G1X0_9FLAO|nr:hypothetical protein BD847_0471 [Flavobacterium cutihirudinis]